MKHLLFPATILLATIFIFSSCAKKEEKSVNNYSAYFGGVLKKQTHPYILLYKEDKIIDTLRVSSTNTFGKRFDALMPGLYHYRINDRFDFIYIDKNDSITLDFTQHKPIYKGKGAEKNEFLLSLLDEINEEKNNCNFLYKKTYKNFKISVDSLRDQRRAFYLRKKTEISWDKEFDIIPKNVIDYSYYQNLEVYALMHDKTFIKDSLPADYFNYKQKVDYNNKSLVAFKPYVNYLTLLLNKNSFQNKPNLANDLKALKTADSLIREPLLKNKITYELAKNYVLDNANVHFSTNYFTLFNKLNTNVYYKNKLNALIKQVNLFKNEIKLPDVKLVTLNNDTLKEFKSNKEQLLFFWSASNLSQYHKQLIDIETFVNLNKTTVYAINIDDVTAWKTQIPQNNSNLIHLNTTNFDELRQKWAVMSLNRLILLAPDGTITEPFASWVNFKKNK